MKIPESFGDQLKGMGLTGIKIYPTVADRRSSALAFEGEITKMKIEQYEIPILNSIKCAISCMGADDTAKLIGLNALQRWKVCIDIPSEILSMS